MVLAGRKTSPSHLITPSLIIPLASFELDEALIKGVNLWLSLQLLLQFAPPVRREGGGAFDLNSGYEKKIENPTDTMLQISSAPILFLFGGLENSLANPIGGFSNMHWIAFQICLRQGSGDRWSLLHFSGSETLLTKAIFAPIDSVDIDKERSLSRITF